MQRDSNIWHYLKSGAGDAAANMALDEALMWNALEIGRPVLRFYSWTEPAATFGYFQPFAQIAAWTPLRPLIRRPTGGGLVPHDADWTYSLVFPNTHPWYGISATQSYERLHSWVQAAFTRCRMETALAPAPIPGGLGQCFIGAEQFDLLANGRKIAGAAQRRSKSALLIQGSIQPLPRGIQREEWESAMLATGVEQGASGWKELSLMAEGRGAVEMAERLAEEKYRSDGYNKKR